MCNRVQALVLVLLLLLGPARAAAFPPDPGSIGAFFTDSPIDTWRSRMITTQAFAPFDIYALSYAVPDGMEAYEFSMPMPAGVVVGGGRQLPEGATDFGPGDDNWIVGTGGICHGESGWFTLVRYANAFVLAAANDLPVCIAGATPTSFPGGEPGYLVCASPGNLQTFGPAYFGCAVINCTQTWCYPDPVDARSFGALKASY